jgi:hypothetical protein
MKTSVSPVYVQAIEAIKAIIALMEVKRGGLVAADVYPFEDEMNGLSGAILGLENELQLVVQSGNAEVVARGRSAGVTVRLHSSVLPLENVSHGTIGTTVLGKKLYPLTTSAVISSNTTTVTVANATSEGITTSVVTMDANVASTLTDDLPDDIDPLFDELDAEIVTEEPLSTLQNETAPYLSNSLIELAKTAAAYSELQDGLVTFSQNPLADLIGTTKSLFLHYTLGNYANLNTALSVIYADSNLATQYKELREAIGGADGLAGCVSQMDFLLEHTNRLSGLILDVDSPNDVTDNDSTQEFIYTSDFSSATPAVIFSFDARYFRSATYTVQATAAALDRGHQVTSLIILHDNFHSYTRETATVYSQDPFVTFTSRLLNNRVEVLASTTAANTDLVIQGMRLRIARASKSYGEMSQTRIIENHELLQAYLDDGEDYVSSQSQSLLRGDLTASLAQTFNDMLINFTNASFLGQSTANKQAGLLAMAQTIKGGCAAIQARIDADYEEFVRVRKLAEALDIAYNLSVAYTDSTGQAIPAVTLNSATKSAILEDQE